MPGPQHSDSAAVHPGLYRLRLHRGPGGHDAGQVTDCAALYSVHWSPVLYFTVLHCTLVTCTLLYCAALSTIKAYNGGLP